MTDKELIQALRHCGTPGNDCDGCIKERECYHEMEVHPMVIAADRLETLLAENEHLREVTKIVPKWVSVSERLPENEKDVLIAFTRKGLRGDVYRCVGMAFHTDGKTTAEDSSYIWEVGYIDMEYNEEADAYIIPEGWWETVNFGETFSAVDMSVTHWMPIPELPLRKGQTS